MNIDEFFEIFTGGNHNVATWKVKAIKEFATDFHNMKMREHNGVYTENPDAELLDNQREQLAEYYEENPDRDYQFEERLINELKSFRSAFKSTVGYQKYNENVFECLNKRYIEAGRLIDEYEKAL